ncbi:MAG: PTS sugar transporter subunit IIB [Erysipelotrichaceae bacterium]|nr:PTS sugar transporter subunit IIB [Erysipelotrichaceae bacterium]
MKIVICCSQGMSSSALVIKMKKYIKENQLDIEVIATTTEKAINTENDFDVLLLGPHIRTEKKRIEKVLPGKTIEVIDMKSFGRFDGEAVVRQAIEALQDRSDQA